MSGTQKGNLVKAVAWLHVKRLKMHKPFVKVDARQIAACDLLEAVEGNYQNLRSFEDLNTRACVSAFKIYVLRGMHL